MSATPVSDVGPDPQAPAADEDAPGKVGPPIVGIGASAGGLEAFIQLLSNLPGNTGMGFVLVQHLDPSHESHLCELLSRCTKMPVREAGDGMKVLADCVYVIPPGFSLSLSEGALRLAPRADAHGLHLPIDMFFRSLADHNLSGSIGIILSGTGSDGAHGLKEIRAGGGITFVQDPRTAGQGGMPQSAIDEGLADFILPPAGIAKELVRFAGKKYLLAPESAGTGAAHAADGFDRILDLVRNRKSVDFTLYRDSTLRRRILRRMALRHMESVGNYARILEEESGEIDALYRDMLISVTNFFRDPEVFESLKTSVFPEIAKGKSQEIPVRIWVAGCSSGEEAYTLAILLLEFLGEQARPPPFQIFASDLSEAGALDKARQGLYPESIESDVTPERLERFFTREGKGYRIRKDIRNHCIFAMHDMVADPPFSRVDLVTCRNVLIYMSPALQRKVFPIFHYALNPGGYLLLGSSETVGRDSDLFRIVDRDHKIYSRISTTSRLPHFLVKHAAAGSDKVPHQAGTGLVSHADFRKEADRILLARFPPASVLINSDLQILQFRGRTRPYLEPAQGEASLNLLKMANEGLFLDLRAVVQEAQVRNAIVEKKDVRVRDGDRVKIICLEVIPVALPISKETCFLVLFKEEGEGEFTGRRDSPPAIASPEDELPLFRKENESLREYLQSIRDQHDSAIEELKSSNEELLSSNEELQSTNEELETAKEEYQAGNEELTTVNEEMTHRSVEMALLNNDLNNLLNSINVPIVIVGGDLRIRRFTAAAGKSLPLIPSDLGRPMRDLHWEISLPDLGQVVLEVVASGDPQTHEVRNREGKWQSLRVHPYRTSENRIDGAVIILMDIHALKTYHDKLQETEEYARSILATVRVPLLILREDLRINTANASFYEMFGTTPGDSEGQLLFKPEDAKWNAPGLRELLEGSLLRDEAFDGFEMELKDGDAGPRTLLLNGRTLVRETGKARMFLLSIVDITEYKRAQEVLKSQSTILEKAVLERTADLLESNTEMEAFSYSISHDLRAPLRAMQGYAEALLKDFGGKADSEAREHLRKIIQSGLRMDRLIRDVLTYSRTALAGVTIENVDLDSLVKDVIRQYPELLKPEVTLIVESPLAPVMGHESSLAQCLSNLFLNAVKFASPGTPPCVRIRTEPHGPDVRIWIEDNGIGIDPKQNDRIFGMFEKLNRGETYAGTGIGLAIVKKAMERMGGAVGVESELGEGSRFWLQLPKEPAQ
ncbi:MAG TPA: chemotaxis protein CheB [Fibrobacteria bacterium]|nr:chemotaxis protein CheB [Fibrobacteria bacterium]